VNSRRTVQNCYKSDYEYLLAVLIKNWESNSNLQNIITYLNCERLEKLRVVFSYGSNYDGPMCITIYTFKSVFGGLHQQLQFGAIFLCRLVRPLCRIHNIMESLYPKGFCRTVRRNLRFINVGVFHLLHPRDLGTLYRLINNNFPTLK
jgi:hypothetical protein